MEIGENVEKDALLKLGIQHFYDIYIDAFQRRKETRHKLWISDSNKNTLTIPFKLEQTSKRCLACNTSKSEPSQNKNMYENE